MFGACTPTPARARRTRSSPRTACPATRASEWDVAGAGDPSIQGFATDISVNQRRDGPASRSTPTRPTTGSTSTGWATTAATGARKVATVQPSATLPQTQPACLTDAATGLVDCGNWAVSASWAVPADAVSGIYFAKLVRDGRPAAPATSSSSCATTTARSDLLFQTSDTTWQAYNHYGGNSLYVGGAGRAAPTRSATTARSPRAAPTPEDWVFNAEYPMVRWLERNGYDVSYTTGVDTDRRGAELLEHKVFLSVGHDEYWSGAQRANVEAARDAGVNLAFFSGNEVFWKTRWEHEHRRLGDAVPHARLLQGDARQREDRSAGRRLDRHLARPALQPARRRRPARERADRHASSWSTPGTTAIQVPADDGKLRFWRNTSVADAGSRADRDAGRRHARLRVGRGSRQRLPAGRADPAVDHDGRRADRRCRTTARPTAPGTATHSLTLYRHAQRRAGLRRRHGPVVVGPRRRPRPRRRAAPTSRMQQATVNLLADMGVAAGDAAGRPGRRRRRRPTPPRRPRRSPRRPTGATVPRGHAGHDHRHGDRRRRRRRRRRRGLGRRRHDLASGDRPRRAGRYTWTPAAAGPVDDPRAAPSTTAATSRRRRPASRSRSPARRDVPLHRSGRRRSRPSRRPPNDARPSSSA